MVCLPFLESPAKLLSPKMTPLQNKLIIKSVSGNYGQNLMFGENLLIKNNSMT